ncbi:MAG: hypothetical protein APG12_00031 [Candidatus Methanofastidiosum methylothiophilum]|uniref:Uncharacterized protein n=1 Tax=Candidatus Methanofastidiosum methylothiophilum TaxID=1705564 RepID=A0A150IK33_9EURY|nr:MAG: hypothetical protein APG10_01000 [Candidatus Methanofastidiosum methylthiophilus]KYC48721.1 MAG: hypothetical protein APG11_00032 [Candidatus Methanofastidiosum methylthiophilus]KYC51369.1 MAG: hypothetical protein APG12_00031 [Candidatus Methanofastidiosum methylthiophilus]
MKNVDVLKKLRIRIKKGSIRTIMIKISIISLYLKFGVKIKLNEML